jgi:hypothetical protein
MRVVVVVERGETLPSPSFVPRGVGWGDLPSVLREWAGRPPPADRVLFRD